MKRYFTVKFILFFILTALISLIFAYFFGVFKISEQRNDSQTASSPIKYTTVIIDAGHGGEDGGASSKSGLIEKDLNLEIAQILKDMFTSNGINVIMTREDDRLLYDRNTDYHGRKKVLDLAARLNIAQSNPNSIFISIHMNAFTEERYSGLQVWYSKNTPESYEIAKLIQENTHNYIQTENNRKVKAAGSSIYLLDKATSPSVLVECGFLSNVAEAEKLKNSAYLKQISFIIFNSVCEFMSFANN